jgi:hypothetical protein
MIVWNGDFWVVTQESHRWILALRRNMLPPFSGSDWGFSLAVWVCWAGILQSISWPVTKTVNDLGFEIWQWLPLGSTQPPIQWILGLKQLSVRLTTPSSAKVKNEWRYNFTPSLCLHGMYKDKFTLLLTWVGWKEDEKLGPLWPWRLRRHSPRECWYPPPRLHSVTTLKTTIWTVTAMKTW